MIGYLATYYTCSKIELIILEIYCIQNYIAINDYDNEIEFFFVGEYYSVNNLGRMSLDIIYSKITCSITDIYRPLVPVIYNIYILYVFYTIKI